MPAPDCLSDAVLQSLLIGGMTDAQAAPYEEHLAQCPECAERTRHLKTSDTLVALVAEAGRIECPAEEKEAARQLIERLSDRSKLSHTSPTLEATFVTSHPDQAESLSASPGDALRTVSGATASSLSPSDPTAVTAAPASHPASTASSHTMVLQPEEGTVLGVYRLEKKLGEGGMGAVWKAFHTRLKKFVALKVLPAHLLRDAGLVARFDREMEAVGRLDHPAIVRAMDAGEVQGTHYLVMEYVEGQDLGQLVKAKGARSVRDACEIIRQAAVGLAYAHKNGLVHRDIKPSNLFLTKDGKVKILDLGLARLQGDGAGPDLGAGLTGTGQILGTPDYMAPEQWENTHTVGPACDLYALGCTLFFLLTGRAPFADDRHQTFPRKMLGHVSEAPPELSTVRGELMKRAKRPAKAATGTDADAPAPAHDIPEDVEAIYRRLMAKEPAERYPSAEALAQALQAWLKAKSDASTPGDVGPTSNSASVVPSQTAKSEFEPSAAPATGATQAATVQVETQLQSRHFPSTDGGSGNGKKWIKWTLLGSASAVLLLGIIITIRHKDGRETKIPLQTGDRVEISEEAAKPQPQSGDASRPALDFVGWHGWPANAPKPAIAPFDAAKAKQHQEEWAKYLNVPVEYTNSIGMKFQLIPPGEYLRGSTKEEVNEALKMIEWPPTAPYYDYFVDCIRGEAPQHRVILTKPFYIGSHEVTQSDYKKVMHVNPSHFANTGPEKALADRVEGLDTSSHPVEFVSWVDAAEFCAILSRQELLKPNYFRSGESVTILDGTGYRLPTEAEWEYASRAGTTTRYWSGEKEDNLSEVAWTRANSGQRPHACGELRSNPFGLFDVHGNLYEWVQDNWDPHHYDQFLHKTAIDPLGPTISSGRHVLRGSAYDTEPMRTRLAFRNSPSDSAATVTIGFRILLPVDAIRRKSMPSPATTPSLSTKSENGSAQLVEAIDFAAERKAAEALIELRNRRKLHLSVSLHRSNGTYLTDLPNKVTDLPEDPFTVARVHCQSANLEDEDLDAIDKCNQLQEFILHKSPRLTDAGFRRLRSLKRLKQFQILDYCNLGGDELASFITANSGLVHVDLIYAAPTPVVGAALCGCRELKVLRIQDTGMSADVYAKLARGCRNLRTLHVIEPHGVDLKALASLPFLKDVWISGEHLKSERFEENVAALLAMPSLDTLAAHPPMNDEHLARLAPLGKKLRELTMPGYYDWDPGLSTNGWKILEDFTALQSLDIGGRQSFLDGPTLLRIAKLPSLRKLNVSIGEKGQLYTAADVDELRKQRPDIELSAAIGKETRTFPALDHYPRDSDGRSLAPWNLPERAPSPAVIPYTLNEAKKHQQAWADFLKQPVEIENDLGMKFRLIPPSEFVMKEDGKRHLVRVPQAFHLGTTEVTFDQFQKFVAATGYKTDAERQGGGESRDKEKHPEGTWKTPGFDPQPDGPVTTVTRADIRAFCEWLGGKDKAVYRLPSEIEWEASARAGGPGDRGWCETEEDLRAAAWLATNLPAGAVSGPQPVGRKAANPFGLYDVLGNVWEVCAESWEQSSEIHPPVAPLMASLRGSSVYDSDAYLHRSPWVGDWRQFNVGFRLLRELPGATQPTKPLERSILVRRGQPLSSQAVVSRPAKIEGLRSWSVEMAMHHGVALSTIVWSPTGDTIATAYDQDPGIRLWNSDGKLLRVLLGHSGVITDLSFSHDGKLLASCERVASDLSTQSTVRVWDVATGVTRVVLTNAGWNWCVAFAPDRYELAFNGPGGGLALIDLTTSRTRHFRGPGVQSVSWSPDGRSLITGNQDGEVTLWRLAEGSLVQKLPVEDPVQTRNVSSFAWSPDNKVFAEWRWDQKVRLWDASTGKRIRDIPAKFPEVGRLFWSRDNRRLLLAGRWSPAWTLLDSTDGTTLLEAEHGTASLLAAWNPDESEIVGWNHYGSGQLLFYDAATGKVRRRGQEFGQSQRTWLEATSPDGRSFTLTAGSAVRSFETETGSVTRGTTMDGAFDATFTWSPDGKIQAIPINEAGANVLALVEATTGERRQTLRVPEAKPDERQFNRVDWSPDSRRIATSSEDGRVRIWNVEEGRLSKELTGHQGRVWNVSWSPDGTKIASAGVDKSVRIWDAERGELRIALTEFPEEPLRYYGERWSTHNLAWSSDSRSLWIGLARHAVRYDLSGRRFEALQPLSNGSYLNTFSVSPDGTQLLGQEEYGWTVLRDLNTSQSRPVAQFLGFHPIWLPDSRRFLGDDWFTASLRGFDTRTDRRLGTLYPFIGSNGRYDHWLCIGPTGHYRGSEGIDEHIVYVALHEDGRQLTYTPAEFREKFGWKNDPAKATLMKLSE